MVRLRAKRGDDVPTDLAIRCTCGSLRGIARGISGASGNRVVCHCDDCQSFAHFLGSADRILDPHGGTDIFQISAGRLEITAGADRLSCMRLKPGGLLRWYAGCCRTPIANTVASRQLPFVGLIHGCMADGSDGRSRDDVLGPVRARIHARFAKGDRGRLDAHDRVPLASILRFLGIIALARLRGDHVRSPFFDPRSGAPITPPRVLSAEELAAVEAARDRG
ncbi:MAG: DUF6151 family protein [Candidatus Binatia bacterium]